LSINWTVKLRKKNSLMQVWSHENSIKNDKTQSLSIGSKNT